MYGIHYTLGTPHIVGYIDFDWASDVDDCRSTSGFVFCLSSGPITWSCKKQHAQELSFIEAKNRAIVLASQEALQRCQLMTEFVFPPNHPTILWCDNQSSIHIFCNPVEHQHTKHIELHMHFIYQLIQDGVISLEYIHTHAQVADIFTKPFGSHHYLQV